MSCNEPRLIMCNASAAGIFLHIQVPSWPAFSLCPLCSPQLSLLSLLHFPHLVHVFHLLSLSVYSPLPLPQLLPSPQQPGNRERPSDWGCSASLRLSLCSWRHFSCVTETHGHNEITGERDCGGVHGNCGKRYALELTTPRQYQLPYPDLFTTLQYWSLFLFLPIRFPQCAICNAVGLVSRMVISCLSKLKDWIVWSWTYLWAFWFLLVSPRLKRLSKLP